MKKLTFTAFFSINLLTIFAQQDTVYLKREAHKKIITDRAPQAIFAELGGPGIVLSANYDRRFNKSIGGFGYRFGLGYSFDNSFKFTTIPVGINYLVGDKVKGRFFEAGLNETLLLASKNDFNSIFVNDNQIGNVDVNKNTLLITSLTIGYRSQPTHGGFNFRGGLMPLLVQSQVGLSAYLSFGFSF